MTVNIVVEGPTDQAIIAFVTRAMRPDARIAFFQAGGRSGAASLARSLLATREEPVLVVVDTDTTDEVLIDRLRQELLSYILWGSPSAPFVVATAAPEIEAVLLSSDGFVHRAFRRGLTARESVAAGISPKQVLANLMTEVGIPSIPVLMGRLSPEDVEILSEQALFRTVLGFIDSVG